VARLLEAIYKIPAPATPRTDLVEIFLTGITSKGDGPIKVDLNSQLNNADVRAEKFRPAEMLRLNLTTPVAAQPARLGLLAGDKQGFPNGRRLTDDVVDIELQTLVGAAQTGKLVDALATGDKVDANDNGFSGAFPYLALPNSGAVNGGGGTGAGATDGHPEPTMTPAAAPSQGLTDVSPVTMAVSGTAGAAALAAGGMWWMRRRRTRPGTPTTVGIVGSGDDPTLPI
jgi:hypothetical protein